VNKASENLLASLSRSLLPTEQRDAAGDHNLTKSEINPYSHCELPVFVARVGVSDRSSQDEFCFTSDHDQLATKVRESLETLESPTTIPARFVSVVRECRKQRCQPH
jgi:hypothetical protein